jgi:hypothetical protein
LDAPAGPAYAGLMRTTRSSKRSGPARTLAAVALWALPLGALLAAGSCDGGNIGIGGDGGPEGGDGGGPADQGVTLDQAPGTPTPDAVVTSDRPAGIDVPEGIDQGPGVDAPGDDVAPFDGPGPGMTPDAGGGEVTAAQLLALTQDCTQLAGTGLFATDQGGPADVQLCGLNGAVFWTADMDVDCDGQESAQCNLNTDPDFQNQTAATDSNGNPLDAAALPYVVIPGNSSRLNRAAQGMSLGSVVAVIYQGQLQYGVLGDVGPSAIIGEASYAMASALGIDPDPSTGGTDSGVTYIVFTGDTAIADPIEDPSVSVSIGQQRARDLLANN